MSSVDALLDGVLIEATPRLRPDRHSAELTIRVVISHTREMAKAHSPKPDAVQTPSLDYSRLATTARVPLGRFSLVGTTAVRRGEDDVAAVVDAQADPTDTPRTRRRRLERAAGKIEYWQTKRKRSARSHRKRRLRELRRRGIRISELHRC
jgi:hypothetical protein